MFFIFKKKDKFLLDEIIIEKKIKIINIVKNNKNWINMLKKLNDEEIWFIIKKWYIEQNRENNINFLLKNIINEIINE